MNSPRILIADDHQLFAEALRSLLEPEVEVAAIVTDGRSLVTAAVKHQPDAIVTDIAMPSLNGIEAALQLRSLGVKARVIFLTMHHDVSYARRALEAGAAGFVLKHSAAAELITALRDALRGQTYISGLIAGELFESYQEAYAPSRQTVQQLTPRQREVLQLFAEGRSAKEVATVLKLSTRTAEFHKARILKVLRLHTTAELIQYAIRHGIITV